MRLPSLCEKRHSSEEGKSCYGISYFGLNWGMQSKHLPILLQLTNGNPVLTLGEVADFLHVTPQHLYNLSSQKRLPFKRLKTRKFLVSVVELAEYLDREALSVREGGDRVEGHVAKKKIGRPRKK